MIGGTDVVMVGFPFGVGFWLYEQATWPEPHRFAGAAWSPSFRISGPRLAAQLM